MAKVNKLELTNYELMQPSTQKILKYFDERLTKLRIENDSFEAHTSLRGQILEIKAFQKAIKPQKSE